MKRRIRAALGRADAMPPPSICTTRPMRSRDPGPSIPAAPGRCPLHQGQLGWNMLMPCEACIALAHAIPVPSVPNYSSCEASASFKHGAEQHLAVPGLASSAILERPSQDSDGVPPPPRPIACFRHRGGRGWSLSDPCEACLQIAFDADLG